MTFRSLPVCGCGDAFAWILPFAADQALKTVNLQLAGRSLIPLGWTQAQFEALTMRIRCRAAADQREMR
jgi:hypothetical protein